MSEPKQMKSDPEAESGRQPMLVMPGMMLWTSWYGAGASATLEAMKVALEFNRNLSDLGREMIRRTQDEAIAALLRGLAADQPHPPQEAAFADLVRLGMETVTQSMTAATRTFGADRLRTEAPEAGAKTAPDRSRSVA